MSRRLTASFLCALLLSGSPAAALAQEGMADPASVWDTSVKRDAVDVAAFGDGFVLVGGPLRDHQGKVWLSADGATWSRVADDEVFDGVALRRVTAFDDGVVALGTQGRKLVSFYSPDGATWTRTTIDRVDKGLELFADAVTDGPAGLIAVASVVARDLAGQRFYGSEDGRTWREIEPPSETSPGMYVSLEATDDEYLAVARPMFTPGTDLYWRSPDAVTWELFEGPDEGDLYDLAIGVDGTYVGVGALAETSLPAIWHADELGTWELVYEDSDSKETEERLLTVAVGGPGFLAGGSTSACPSQPNRYCPSAAILASADGREWQALGVEDGVPGPLHDTVPQPIAANDDTTANVACHEDRPTEVRMLPTGE